MGGNGGRRGSRRERVIEESSGDRRHSLRDPPNMVAYVKIITHTPACRPSRIRPSPLPSHSFDNLGTLSVVFSRRSPISQSTYFVFIHTVHNGLVLKAQACHRQYSTEVLVWDQDVAFGAFIIYLVFQMFFLHPYPSEVI